MRGQCKGAGAESSGTWNKCQSADWLLCRESHLMEGHGLHCNRRLSSFRMTTPATRRVPPEGPPVGSPSAEGETPLCRLQDPNPRVNEVYWATPDLTSDSQADNMET